jgi:LacI family transcriptional regulator
MPTVNEVAARAGVAPITVSRVVNGNGPVSADVRARVEAAIAEIGYVPNAIARSLRSRRTDTFALVLTDMTNPFFTTLAHGAEAAASEAGLMLIVANTNEEDAIERRHLELLLQRRVDGILLVPAGDGAQAIRQCRDQATPLVVVDRRLPGRHVDIVRADSKSGARDLGRLLVGLGHREMTVLTGPRGVLTAADRAAGFRAAAAEEGLPAPRVLYGSFTIESGRQMALQALRATPRPTALFAANNFIAIGVQHALDELGVRVPDDIALVGFDDLPQAMVTFPFLTVAAQPASEIGHEGVAMLLDRMANPGRPPREVVLPTRVIVRGSSGGPVTPTPSRPS